MGVGSEPSVLRPEADPEHASSHGGGRSRRLGSSDVLLVLLLLLIGVYFVGPDWFTAPAVATWSTVFVAICLQALPFLVLGVLLSATVTALVPPSFFERALPRHPAGAVTAAGAAGAVLPGCECASVPIADSLVRRGVAPAAALAFLLSAPAINPVVVVATVVAFPDEPQMAVARFVASLLVAVLMGWAWAAFGRPEWLRLRRREVPTGIGRTRLFADTASHDFVHAGGFLVLGGLTAATLNVLVPRAWLDAVAAEPVLAVLALAVLAVVLAICSEADAFVAASLTSFSLTARLVFLVVGPVVDVKLIALQTGTFGSRFALRFAPATFVVSVACALLVAWVLL